MNQTEQILTTDEFIALNHDGYEYGGYYFEEAEECLEHIKSDWWGELEDDQTAIADITICKWDTLIPEIDAQDSLLVLIENIESRLDFGLIVDETPLLDYVKSSDDPLKSSFNTLEQALINFFKVLSKQQFLILTSQEVFVRIKFND
ncbi:MAG: hypothetical protein QNJ37_04825 [Crocosphaera sp.]|nr:hypothetical protein [Crocosphaera sp.]